MRKYRISVSPAAKNDLRSLLEYYQLEAGVGVAKRIHRAIDRTLERLSEFPAGTRRFDLDNGIHQKVAVKPANNYKIFFRILSESIEIIRILHGAQSEVEAFEEEA